MHGAHFVWLFRHIFEGRIVRVFLYLAFLLLASTALSVNAQDIDTRCPAGSYPYLNRPCNQGQAYVEVHRSHREWLKLRPDFRPLYIELVPVLRGKYQGKCGTNFPWIPETDCGVAYFRPNSTCSAEPSIISPGIAVGETHCSAGCEFVGTTGSSSEPSGAVCMPEPCPESDTFGCGKSVAQLQQAARGPADPRRFFHAQQTCIASKSCKLRCQMDNCQWMDEVVPEFVDPYLGRRGHWPAVETSCDGVQVLLAGTPGGKWIADRECFSAMGWYHVQVDLREALEKYGCGSQSDWKLAGEQIVSCLSETQPGYPQSYYTMGGIFVHLARERVRAQCLAKRGSQGLPTDINSDIGGKVCKAAY